MFSDIHSRSETVVSYRIYEEEDIAALKKALRYSQLLPTVSFLMVLLCSLLWTFCMSGLSSNYRYKQAAELGICSFPKKCLRVSYFAEYC